MTRLFALCVLALLLALSSTPGVGSETAPKIFGQGSWQELTGARKGQKLIVHFWSLACAPCLTELPEWGKFLAGHPGAPLVLVNWETRPQPEDRIRNTLAKAGLAGAEQWALADDFEQKIRFAIDRDWMGELPRTQLIAPDGSSRQSPVPRTLQSWRPGWTRRKRPNQGSIPRLALARAARYKGPRPRSQTGPFVCLFSGFQRT